MNADNQSVLPSTQLAYPMRDAVECTPRGGLPNFFSKLKAGGEIKIAYMGGSITAAAGWRVLTLQWFRDSYPNARISEVNAAVDGTGSGLGCFRLEHNVLRHKPDMLLVEFAVNDSGYSQASVVRTMEGIVRQAWRALPELDICFVYTFAQEAMLRELQRGKYPPTASAMEAVADHYGIPSIHVGLEIARLVKEGQLVFQGKVPATEAEKQALDGRMLFSEDGVHPLIETGHVVYTRVVARSMQRLARIAGLQPGPHKLGEPLAADNWERARMLPLTRAALSGGWRKLDPAQENLARTFSGWMPELWRADQPGASLSFRFKGTCAWIYDIVGSGCGAVRVKLDDQPERVVLRFDPYSFYTRICWLEVATDVPDAEHSVTVTLDGQVPDKLNILFEQWRQDYRDSPEKYAENAWYASALLVIGEMA
jgi:hypothetical protein